MDDGRIVIVGGGFAGVHAAIGAVEVLRHSHEEGVSVELVSPDPYLVIRPRLYERDLAGVRVPLAGVLGPLGVAYRRAAVAEIDAAGRRIGFEDGAGATLYDQLVLAAGSRTEPPRGEGTVHLVDRYPEALAMHQAVGRLADRGGPGLDVIVVGGGFTGIEVATELVGTIGRAAATVGRRGVGRVTLIERGPSVAPEFGRDARAAIEAALAGLGVEVRTGVAVAAVRPEGIVLADDSRVEGDRVVWCTGPRASLLTDQVAAERDGLGRLRVDRFLATGVDGIWAAGDCAAAPVDDGRQVSMMSCQHAMPQGRLAGGNAVRTLLGRSPRRYRQSLYLACLDLDGEGALLTTGYDHGRILATGEEAKQFKRYVNRSLIYPPADADTGRLIASGRPTSVGPLAAAMSALAMRSGKVRGRVVRGAEDRAAAYAATSRARPSPRWVSPQTPKRTAA